MRLLSCYLSLPIAGENHNSWIEFVSLAIMTLHPFLTGMICEYVVIFPVNPKQSLEKIELVSLRAYRSINRPVFVEFL